MPPTLPNCEACQTSLEIKQTCLSIFWYCPVCGSRHPLEDFPEYIDDDMEVRLADVHCNRI
ncbi:MAG: dual CXXC motif small (seleno)protein [Desulfobacteraceae bacterium]|jgi:hypothetical protein